jgi:hypothetical protein
METAFILLTVFVAWQVLRVRYQRAHIALLGGHLGGLRLEKHMETLTRGYTRAIGEESESRQLQVLETLTSTERAVAAQLQSLAEAMQREGAQATAMGALPFCLPYVERVLPAAARDFRVLLCIHAAGLRHVVDNEEGLDPKRRAFRLSAELYLFQHSCHWYCKSRAVADARLIMRHQVQHRNVLDSVSDLTRSAYLRWLQGMAFRD